MGAMLFSRAIPSQPHRFYLPNKNSLGDTIGEIGDLVKLTDILPISLTFVASVVYESKKKFDNRKIKKEKRKKKGIFETL